MGQTINLSVSGLYTSQNDMNGIPPGSLNVATNVESRYKNTLESRRGFEELINSTLEAITMQRLINFNIEGEEKTVALTSANDVRFYDEGDWTPLDGVFATHINAPNTRFAKSRFVRAGQNLYLTSNDGVRSLSSGEDALMLRAGVPKGLNLQAETNGAAAGFFTNNTVLATTGSITNAAAIITEIEDTTGVRVGQFVRDSLGNIPAGTTVLSITESATVLIEAGDTTAGSTALTALVSNAGLAVGQLVSGAGIPEGATITAIAGAGPYTVTLSAAAFQTATGSQITFSTPVSITMSANATATVAATPLTFFSGAQVGYRIIFGRVETDKDGNTITRLGSPSAIAIATNTLGTSTNVEITATLPKNSSDLITFYQLYRSSQTPSAEVTPLDQYQLVAEANITELDFDNRVIVITDSTTDSLRGASLYAGSDQEGILQANDPPPMSWDCCPFRDFMIYVNCTQPSTKKITILAIGGADGIELDDEITIEGTFAGVDYIRTYTAKAAEDQEAGEFQLVTTGTPSQNITDTANSLIRVINFDEELPVHAILVSTTTDLPGQILLECDNPSTETFTVTANDNQTAYDPTLNGVESTINTLNNQILVSKSGETEAVPITNEYFAGDSSSPIYRCVPLRDYVVIIKSDGVYKLQGITPTGLACNPFDLTTHIIGPDTACTLNSGVWMLSNQGVVSISDGGVDAKSPPIDDQLNTLIGSNLDTLTELSFAVGYESDRKYILSVPTAELDTSTVKQYVFNYVTNSWTTWNRRLRCAYIHSVEEKLYIGRDDDTEQGVSKERKTGIYTDYVDESFNVSIESVDSPTLLTLSSVLDVQIGDVLYQDEATFSLITLVDGNTNQVTVEFGLDWIVGDCSILSAISCEVTWKQVFGDNPAFVRQFSEGIALFKNTRFNTASLNFATDFDRSNELVPIYGNGTGLWGLFGWGEVPWGGTLLPQNIRFIIPQNKQLGSYLIPSMKIRQGYSNFKFQGMAIVHSNVSFEVGK